MQIIKPGYWDEEENCRIATIIKCDCGTEIQLWEDEECPKCHQWYNRSAQKLRDNWMDNPSNYDDDIGDMEGYEMSQHDY